MRIKSNSNGVNHTSSNNQSQDISKVTAGQLNMEMQYLEPLFTSIILVNPYEQRILNVLEYKLEDSGVQCTEVCPLRNDACGCICKDVASTGENRCRYVYNKTAAHLVIGRKIQMQFKEYVLVMIMKLNPSFQFGTYKDTEAIDSITKLSSNLVIDPLTKIFNRKYLVDNITYLMENCYKQRQPLCLACIDIDNFKRFNDSYGHDFGDKVLITVAENMCKATDVLPEAYNIRIGGDEFVIVGVNVEKQRFKAIMNKLCMMVDNTKLPFGKEMVGIRISIGVSEMMSDGIQVYKELYEKADGQLYKAKEAGKGCVR